jgi:hypothetical protein
MLIREMSDEEIRAFLARVVAPATDVARRRRDDLHRRWLAMHERHLASVEERIGEIYEDAAVVADVRRHAREIWNPLRRVVNRVAKAYQIRPRRRISKKDAKKENEKLARFLRSVSFNAHAKRWNRGQVAYNCVVVLVRPCETEDGKPTIGFDAVTGAHAEVIQHPKAPYGSSPAVLGYSLLDRGSEQRLGLHEPGTEAYALVDRERWRFFGLDPKPGEFRDVEHGLGKFPGVPLRLEPPEGGTDDDWWGSDYGRGLSQVVADVGAIAAAMNWTRKIQSRNLVTVLEGSSGRDSDDDDQDEGQHLGHPESVLRLSGENMDLKVSNLDTPIKGFKEHIEYMTGEVSEVITGSSSAFTDPEPGLQQADTTAVQSHAALRELQQSQIEQLDDFERKLIPIACSMAKSLGVEDVPDPKLVEQHLEVYFPPLPFLDTPTARLDYHVKATAFGVNDQVDYVMETEGVDEETAHEIVLRKAERRAKLHKLLATHNTPSDPTQPTNSEARPELAGERPEAQTGRFGGRARPTRNANNPRSPA